MISRKMMTKIFCGNFEKSFLSREKIGSIKSRKVYSGHWRYNRRTAKWCKKYHHQRKYVVLVNVWKTWCEGNQGAFRVRPTPKIRQEFRSCRPSGRRGADASNLVPSPQARLSPLPTANAKERRSNEDKKVDRLKTYGSVYLFMFIITGTTF